MDTLLLFLGLLCAFECTIAFHSDILSLYARPFKGEGTYYGHSDTGLCQYNPPSLPPAALDNKIRYTVALNKPQSYNSLACGMCFRVHGSGQGGGNDPITGDFVVFVNNVCPECHAGSLDFGVPGDGRWKIDMQAVQCPVGNTKLQYKFQGSNPWYMKLQVRNARIPVTEAQVEQGGSYEDMKHTSDGFWVLSNGHQVYAHGGIHVKLTAANGETVIDVIPKLANDVVLHGNNRIQFKLDHRLPSA